MELRVRSHIIRPLLGRSRGLETHTSSKSLLEIITGVLLLVSRSRCNRGPAVRVTPAGDEFGCGRPPAVAAAAVSPRQSRPCRPWWATERQMGWECVGSSQISPTVLAREMTPEAAVEAEEALPKRCDTRLSRCAPRLSRRLHRRCRSTCSSSAPTLAPCLHCPRNPS